MTYYLTYENSVRGFKCTRCETFIVYEDYQPHVCECYGPNQCMNYAPVTRDPNQQPDKPFGSPPPFRRNRRTKNWHLDPKYKEQWKGRTEDQSKSF